MDNQVDIVIDEKTQDAETSKDANETDDDSVSVGTVNTSASKSSLLRGKVRKSKKRGRRSALKTALQPYKYTYHCKQSHGQSLFGVQFNRHLPDNVRIFATAGSNQVCIFQCLDDGTIKLLYCYADQDQEEIFYCCAWSYDQKTGHPLLAAAGTRGIIRIIDYVDSRDTKHFLGHGQAINELKFHPKQPHLLLSGSKDHSLRLWNIESDVCVAIFSGVDGHRDEVLSVDFNRTGTCIMSSGMDHSLKMWRIDTEEFIEKLALSRTFPEMKSNRPFPTIMAHFPEFSTRDIHRNYVDCVLWYNNFILSKACESQIVCWKPDCNSYNKKSQPYIILQEFEFQQCELWFIRFDFNVRHHVLALGNQFGKIFVWELDRFSADRTRSHTLSHNKCTTAVRQTSFSRDANVLISVCDDGTVWRWDRRTN